MHGPTLLLLTCILLGMMTLALAAARSGNRHIPGLGAWTLSYLCGFLGSLSFLFRPPEVSVTSVLLAQGLLFTLAYLNLAGARAYMGRRPFPAWSVGAMLVLLLGVAAFFTTAVPNTPLRVGVLGAVCGALFLASAFTMARGTPQLYPARYFLALACAVHGLILIVRPWLFEAGGALGGRGDGSFLLSEYALLESIVALVMMAFGVLMAAHAHTTEALRQQAERDPLTGVYNSRAFAVLLDKAAHLAGRMGTPLTLLVVDLDNFKRINDTWGHRSGDLALRHFVNIATRSLRTEDIMGRIGGEEFAICLPNTLPEHALSVAERLRADVVAHPALGEHGTLAFTVSIGLARCSPDESPAAALHRADQAMYRAKQRGRNRVETLPASEPGPLEAMPARS